MMARIRAIHPIQWADEAKAAGRNHHLYVLEEEGGPVKIGIARNAFWRRGDLQCGNPRTLTTVAVYACETRAVAAAAEARVLSQYARDIVRGEWINQPAAVISAFIDQEIRDGAH